MYYPLHLTSFTQGKCETIDKIINPAFLTKMRMIGNMPRAVVHGQLRYGGMETPDCYSLQTILQVPYLMKQLQINKPVANNFLTTKNKIQLVSGLTSPISECMDTPIDDMDSGWIVALQERMWTIDASLWIEESLAPQLQCQNDSSLIAEFSKLPWRTPLQLSRVNTVRICQSSQLLILLTQTANLSRMEDLLESGGPTPDSNGH